ncbi:MAG TPA: TonB-dependent receptor [Steroidobacteraceae bacterium]|jgi:outer membrane receptor protein involved in Fe transport|nr:TonB-dependent receptor [Steroidobacteraceae bacterium]
MPGRRNNLELRMGHEGWKPIAGICAALAALAALSPASLRAADADTADAAASTGPLQEIVVTATRHEESLSKVPISVTALSQDAMDIRGIKDIVDVARFTPGVDIDNSGTNNISIRGIASTGGAGTTGIYLDDTPIQMRALAFNPDEALPKSFDIDRIEVLRGPQGTLFGSGSEGGTVRYITVQPSLDKTSFYSREELSYTQGGSPSYEAGIAGGTPLIDGTLGVRASVWYRRDGGWIDRIDPVTLATDQKNSNYDETMLVRLAAVYAPVEQLHITPSFYYQDRYRNDVESYWPLYSNPGQDRYVSANPTQRSAPDRFYLPALKMEADFGATKLVSNTSYYHRKDTTGYDGTLYNLGFYQTFFGPGYSLQQPLMLDGGGVHLPAGATDYRSPASVDNYQQNFTQEIRLQSNDPAARLIWTTGVFFSVNRQRYLEQIHDPLLNELTEAATGMPYTDVFTDPNGNPVPFDPRYPNDSYFLLTNAKDQQLALYGEGTYSFTDQLKLTLGARVSHAKYSFYSLTGGPQLFLSPQSVGAEKSENSFTPKVSFSYQYDPRNLYYFTYAKGYRPGGGNNPVPEAACGTDFQSLGIKSSPLTFDSDTVNSYEVGAKNNFDNRIKLASSIYYIRWNNIQQTVIPPICQISFIANLGTAIAKGIDLQADVAITDSFTVELATGYTDARYTSDSRLTPLESPPVVSRGDAITGQSAQPQAPFTASIGLEYKFSVFDLDSFMRVDDEYVSRAKWPSPGQDPSTQQFDAANYVLPSNNFASARAGVHVGDWEVAAFVDNLADTHAVTNYEWSIDPGDGESRLQRQFTYRPRTFGFTFTFRSK